MLSDLLEKKKMIRCSDWDSNSDLLILAPSAAPLEPPIKTFIYYSQEVLNKLCYFRKQCSTAECKSYFDLDD